MMPHGMNACVITMGNLDILHIPIGMILRALSICLAVCGILSQLDLVADYCKIYILTDIYETYRRLLMILTCVAIVVVPLALLIIYIWSNLKRGWQ